MYLINCFNSYHCTPLFFPHWFNYIKNNYFDTFTILEKGRVIKSTGNWYHVLLNDNKILLCRLPGSFRIKGIKTTNPIAVGDDVFIKREENKEGGVIIELIQRRNYMIRQATNLSKRWHIIASNIDIGVLVVSLRNPKVMSSFIDRYLITAEAYSIPTVIVFNKIDIYQNEDLELMQEYINGYTAAGYSCLQTSVSKNIGLDNIETLINGKTSLFSGYSGVGKSSLISALHPNTKIKIGETSVHEKGKHTTTFAEMHVCKNGTYIIDTPGVKSFGIVDFKREEVAGYYPEFFALSKNCKFNNCTHLNEPGCAVLKSLEQGSISEYRYENYVNIYEGDGYRNHWEDK